MVWVEEDHYTGGVGEDVDAGWGFGDVDEDLVFWVVFLEFVGEGLGDGLGCGSRVGWPTPLVRITGLGTGFVGHLLVCPFCIFTIFSILSVCYFVNSEVQIRGIGCFEGSDGKHDFSINTSSLWIRSGSQ